MRSRLVLLTLVAGLLFPALLWSQRDAGTPKLGTVRGQLRLPGGSPAPMGIPVLLIYREGDMAAQSQTDSSGKFTFDHLNPGIYRIKVHAMGYQDIESYDLDLNMNPMAYLSYELKLTAGGAVGGGPAPASTISLEALSIPEGARKDMATGEQFLQKGDYARSIESFKKAIKAYPGYAEAYLMMGVAYRAQSNIEEAGAALRKCIELNPRSGPAYAALGEVYNDRKDYAEAEKTLLKAVELLPESFQAHEELARTYWAQQNWQQAEPHAARALALAPNSPAAHLLMGNIELRKKNGQAALLQFQEYLKLDPNGALAPGVRDLVAKLQQAMGQQQQQPVQAQPEAKTED
jgi:tetratricopeptide (TPR) repeat protein